MGYAQALRDDILNWFRGTTMPTVPATLYVALLTTNPSDETGTGLVEVPTSTWTNYARQSIASSTAGWAAPSGTNPRKITNANTLTLPSPTMSPSSATVTVVGIALYDASTAGTFWGWVGLTASKVINNGDTVTFAAGALEIDQ
jgi:hypothetical protein